MIQHISAVTFAVRDMDRSIEFYKKLGFELSYGGEHAAFSSMKAGEAFANLSVDPRYEHRWWGRAIFRVDDVDAHYRALQAQVLLLEAPRDAAWGERFFHLTDPEDTSLASRSCCRCAYNGGDCRGQARPAQRRVCAEHHEPAADEVWIFGYVDSGTPASICLSAASASRYNRPVSMPSQEGFVRSACFQSEQRHVYIRSALGERPIYQACQVARHGLRLSALRVALSSDGSVSEETQAKEGGGITGSDLIRLLSIAGLIVQLD